MNTITTAPAVFTAADLDALDILAASMHRPCTVERCAEDGPEWAALLAAPEDGEGHPDDLEVLVSVHHFRAGPAPGGAGCRWSAGTGGRG